jgi:hypothetical protein
VTCSVGTLEYQGGQEGEVLDCSSVLGIAGTEDCGDWLEAPLEYIWMEEQD